ncbi:MAG: ABC transporter permease [Chloroflexota bacterium]|jgi:ABC-2 type transport system permease protein|nr:ABC transporter permease [Chloroflexota bacterium]MDH5242395.1 ABC transporter permease [Chloroflexota bacterium]
MSAPPVTLPPAASPVESPRTRSDERSVPGAGWMVVGAKEFGDHLLSARFVVLAVVLGLAAATPLYFATGSIRDIASTVTDARAVFIALFWLAPDVGNQVTLPSVSGFLAYVAPLLGLAFAFDAINGERADGTLPRLLSQPIHRDDVINGKFVAGLAVIGVVLVSVLGAIAAFGLIRLGIVPAASEVLRIVLWVLLTFVYVSLWLAFGMLLSVVIRRAATSALIGFGTWLLLTFFGGLIVSLAGGILAPVAGTAEEQLQNIGIQETLRRFLPDTLYREASLTLLNPQVSTVSTPATLSGYEQAQQRIPSLLSLDQSFILVWPQVVGLVAMTVACFALAYVMFMRQEVRA